jgi:SHS2 domain-containing protein
VYEWRSHTAELELAIEGETEAQVFADAVAAFAELVLLEAVGPTERRTIELGASDRASLLVELLEELIFLADTESFVAEQVDGLRLEDESLRATLVGRRVVVQPLVKAATYHGLQFARNGKIWKARVVLDV